MIEPLVSIIIVNWNGGEVFDECIKSLKKLKYKNWELIVIDNGSTDGTGKFATIKNKKNLGFAPANNQGFELAKGKYVLLLNNDTKVSSDLLSVMISKMESDKTIGAMQPKIYLIDKSNYLDNSGAFLNTLGFTEHWGFGKKDSKEFDQEREVFSVKGACLLTRKEVVDKIGLFDYDFVSYYEESDFCFRVWISGWRVIYFPETFIHHKGGYTSKKLPVFDVNFHSLKNRISSFIKNFEVHNLIIYLGIHLFTLLILSFVYLVKFNFKKIKMIIDALSWNITHLSDTLEKRKTVQKMRVKKDSEILPIIMHRINLIDLVKHFFATEKNF